MYDPDRRRRVNPEQELLLLITLLEEITFFFHTFTYYILYPLSTIPIPLFPFLASQMTNQLYGYAPVMKGRTAKPISVHRCEHIVSQLACLNHHLARIRHAKRRRTLWQ